MNGLPVDRDELYEESEEDFNNNSEGNKITENKES